MGKVLDMWDHGDCGGDDRLAGVLKGSNEAAY